jgi:general stress protein 26
MNNMKLRGELDPRFSAPEATATSWEDARDLLESAEIYWLMTVRADGRPHVTPLIAVWVDDAMYFATGEDEQKAKNLRDNQSCALTTGCNAIGHGLDVVVEGTAVRVISQNQLELVAGAIEEKYGPD